MFCVQLPRVIFATGSGTWCRQSIRLLMRVNILVSLRQVYIGHAGKKLQGDGEDSICGFSGGAEGAAPCPFSGKFYKRFMGKTQK